MLKQFYMLIMFKSKNTLNKKYVTSLTHLCYIEERLHLRVQGDKPTYFKCDDGG